MSQPNSDRIDALMKAAFGEPLLEGSPPHPVDKRLLEQYHNNELDQLTADHISLLVANYRDWHDASMEVLTRLADEEEVRETVSAALLLQWMAAHRRRMLIAASLVLLAGVTFWMSSGGSGLRDGDLLVAYRDGVVSGLDEFPADMQQSAERAFAGRLEESDAERELRKEFGGRGVGDEAQASPVGTAVRSQRPTMSWPAFAAGPYQVVVYDRLGNRVAESAETELTTWTPVEDLQRGAAYSWRVTATNVDNSQTTKPNDAEDLWAFYVLPEADADAVEQALNNAGASHVLRFAVYAEAGLFQDARAELEALRTANGDTREVEALERSLQDAMKAGRDE